jgi:hypothetical protein
MWLWHQGKQSPDDPPGAVVLANLPGSHGATVVSEPRAGQPLSIVLPPPLTARVRVTVAGAAPTGRPGSIRVLAAYEGRGKGRLASVLNVETTAQEDGSFELAGLTPGRYTIQAALDDVWLSPSVGVSVPDQSVQALTLAIPAPGGSAIVKVMGADGKPVPGRRVTIERPVGPLSARLWPAEFTTDGAGEAYIPALEAGRHTLRAEGSDAAKVEIPPLPVERPAEVQLRLPAEPAP